MKKFIALAIAVVMLAALAVPAFAENLVLTYNVEDEYTFSVPATFDVNTETNVVVALEDVNVATAVTVTVAGAFKLGEKAYKLGDIAAAGTVIDSATEDTSETLAFAWVDGAPTAAGEYSDTLTFTAAVDAE